MIDRQDDDGTVGTDRGDLFVGVDMNNRARFLHVSPQGDIQVALTEDTGHAILKELRKMNFQLSIITGEDL